MKKTLKGMCLLLEFVFGFLLLELWFLLKKLVTLIIIVKMFKLRGNFS